MWKATFLKSHCCHFLLCCLFFLICSNLGIKTQNNRTENRTKTSSKKKKNYKCLCVCFYYKPTTSWQTPAMLLSGTSTSRWKSCPASEARLRYTAGWWAQIRLTAVCLFLWHHLCFEVTDLKQPFFPSTTQTRDMWNLCNLIPARTINISGEWSR